MNLFANSTNREVISHYKPCRMILITLVSLYSISLVTSLPSNVFPILTAISMKGFNPVAVFVAFIMAMKYSSASNVILSMIMFILSINLLKAQKLHIKSRIATALITALLSFIVNGFTAINPALILAISLELVDHKIISQVIPSMIYFFQLSFFEFVLVLICKISSALPFHEKKLKYINKYTLVSFLAVLSFFNTDSTVSLSDHFLSPFHLSTLRVNKVYAPLVIIGDDAASLGAAVRASEIGLDFVYFKNFGGYYNFKEQELIPRGKYFETFSRRIGATFEEDKLLINQKFFAKAIDFLPRFNIRPNENIDVIHLRNKTILSSESTFSKTYIFNHLLMFNKYPEMLHKVHEHGLGFDVYENDPSIQQVNAVLEQYDALVISPESPDFEIQFLRGADAVDKLFLGIDINAKDYLDKRTFEEKKNRFNYVYERGNFDKLQEGIIGPRSVPMETKRGLVAIPIGAKTKENGLLNKLIDKFGFEDFSYILFAYDKTDWSKEEWFDKVVIIHATKSGKWWFPKRFLTPSLLASYDYVFYWDDDMDVESFEPIPFLDWMDEFELDMAQPCILGHTVWGALRCQWAPEDISIENEMPQAPPTAQTRRTNFIEVMVPVYSTKTYIEEIWPALEWDLTLGWGYDFSFVQNPNLRIGVNDKYPVVHRDLKSGRTNSFSVRASQEQIKVMERRKAFEVVPATLEILSQGV